MRVFIVYVGTFATSYYLVTDPHPEDLQVLRRWHEMLNDENVTMDDDEYDAIINAADTLIENWSIYEVGKGDNPSMLADIDQVRFYGTGEDS
jgi:hypothetical protein